ncbi:septum formation inhibitor Maf [Robiginitalea sp. SC105]|uniref:septum formation inhibitor Maf n=1 Tax=Robiginitalea sp. SC105 TaxID=2762332 RepID=UPI0016397968|nr:septum formation inhibitor Maf [Robiginitalea sp. SC105]MBC2840390.1 septum formation inhibitor Maf [Robiginitalea sp. SC105]
MPLYPSRQSPVAVLLFLLLVAGCKENQTGAEPPRESQPATPVADPRPLSEDFKAYWYAGTAEVSSYSLSQARYGELRDGDAVLVYVTEPFDPIKQVKADRPDSSSVSVLKLNRTRKFLTGIYPYSIMSSIFYPVADNRHALKISTSVQEWCGHIFAQLNNRGDFEITAHSYFESEGEQQLNLPKTYLEDELWTRLRIAPEALPLGTQELIPSTEFLRLRHQPFRAYSATLTLSEPGEVRTYTITYPELNRTLQIHFQGSFPYTIQGWTDSYPSGFGDAAQVLTTTARLKKTLKTPYWQQNSNSDLHLRDSLGL